MCLYCVNLTPEEWSGAGGGVEGHLTVIARSSHFTQNTVVQSCNSKLEETGRVENAFFVVLCFAFSPLVLSHSFIPSGKKPNKKHLVKHSCKQKISHLTVQEIRDV